MDAGRTSRYRGLCFDRKHNSWRVRIFFHGKQRHVGRFKDDVMAARAYDKAAYFLYGHSAILNFTVEDVLADPADVPPFIRLAKQQADAGHAPGPAPGPASSACASSRARSTASSSSSSDPGGGGCSSSSSTARHEAALPGPQPPSLLLGRALHAMHSLQSTAAAAPRALVPGATGGTGSRAACSAFGRSIGSGSSSSSRSGAASMQPVPVGGAAAPPPTLPQVQGALLAGGPLHSGLHPTPHHQGVRQQQQQQQQQEQDVRTVQVLSAPKLQLGPVVQQPAPTALAHLPGPQQQQGRGQGRQQHQQGQVTGPVPGAAAAATAAALSTGSDAAVVTHGLFEGLRLSDALQPPLTANHSAAYVTAALSSGLSALALGHEQLQPSLMQQLQQAAAAASAKQQQQQQLLLLPHTWCVHGQP